MRVVTTSHKAGFEQYGHRLLETWHHWPAGTELWWYTEGFNLPADKPDGIVEIDTTQLWALQAFKEKHARYKPSSYLYDVVRFANKVYAVDHAFADFDGIGVWLDADCVMLKDIPAGYIEGHLQGAYMAMLKRAGMYTETGFWVMDCANENHQDFMETWVDWYETGAFKTLSNWTDCETLDATVRKFEKAGRIQTVSLSGDFEKTLHPLAKIELGKYIDHCKGQRKDLGYSPERM